VSPPQELQAYVGLAPQDTPLAVVRLSKDYEYVTQTSEAMIRVAMIHLMIRRLARLPTS